MPSRRPGRVGPVRDLAQALMISACLAQIVVPLARIATSYRATDLHLTPSQILLLSSAFSALPALLAVRMGRYNDRHGHGSAALTGAVVVAASCALLLAPISSVWWLLFVSVLLGLGQTLQLTALQGEVGLFRPARPREGMIGGLMVWQAVGQVAAPLILSLIGLIGGPLSARLALAATALALAGAGLSLILWRNAAQPRHAGSERAGLGRILAAPGLAWVIVAGSLCVAVHDLTLVYMPVVGAARGVPPTEVGGLLASFAIGQMLSRGLYARVTRALGPRWLMLGGVICLAGFTATLVLPLGPVAMAAVLALAGLSMGFAITASVSLTMAMAPPQARTTSLALRLAMNRTGQFLIPLAAGGAAASLGPGAVFLVLGSVLGGVGLYGARRLARA